jgi:hypothetical protein
MNKVANAIKEIVLGMRAAPNLNDKKKTTVQPEEVDTGDVNGGKINKRTINRNSKQLLIIFLSLILCAAGAAIIYRIINYGKPAYSLQNLRNQLPCCHLQMTDPILQHS